jgi:hypothetical protein
MLPWLRDGDRLEIARVCADEIRVGDIVTYRCEDRFPTRRVVGFSLARKELLIQADYTPAKVFRVPVDDTLGRVEARIRGGKRLRRSSLRWRWAAWSAPYRRRVLQIWRRHFRQR